MNDLPALQTRFCAGASRYDEYAVVQRTVAARLDALLGDTPVPSRILEIGCGTGLLTRLLAARYPSAQIDAVDSAPGMLHRARAAFPPTRRVRFHGEPAESFRGNPPYDLLASSSALHWLDLDRCLAGFVALLRPGGRLAMALMVRGTLRELHDCRLLAAPAKPPRARLMTAESVLAILAGLPLDIDLREDSEIVQHYPSAREFLLAIHHQGVTGGNVSRAGAPLTRGELERLCSLYEARHPGDHGGVRSTYNVLLIRAAKRDAACSNRS